MDGHLKVIQSGNIVEFWQFEKPCVVNGIHVRKKRRHKKIFEDKQVYALKLVGLWKDSMGISRSDYNIEKLRFRRPRSEYSGRQRYKSFVRLVQSNLVGEFPIFATFTMRSEFGWKCFSLKDSYRLWSVFGQKLKRHYPGIKWITTPEYQKDVSKSGVEKLCGGALHFHVLIWGLPKLLIDNEIKLQNYAKKTRVDNSKDRVISTLWGHGFVDIVRTDGSSKLAGYLGKYLAKGYFDERFKDHRGYSLGGKCRRATVLKTKNSIAISQNVWGITMGGHSGLEFQNRYGTKYLGQCDYYRYNLRKQ